MHILYLRFQLWKWFLTQRIFSEVQGLGLKIEDFRTSNKGGLDPRVVIDIYVRDPQTTLTTVRTVQREKSFRSSISGTDHLEKLKNMDWLKLVSQYIV